jgi:hypothetical protein
MRNQIVVVASAALATAVVIGVIVVVAFNMGESRTVQTVAQTSPAVTAPATTKAPAKPRPKVTVTVTKHRAVPDRAVAPPQPNYASEDDAFLTAIAVDGIKAPDDWALEAGRLTCGTSYDYAYNYLTDGGLYSYHVQTFLDDWINTHGGC